MYLTRTVAAVAVTLLASCSADVAGPLDPAETPSLSASELAALGDAMMEPFREHAAAILAGTYPDAYEATLSWQPDGAGEVHEACVTVADGTAMTQDDVPSFTGPTGEPLAMTFVAIQDALRDVSEDEDDGLMVVATSSDVDELSVLVAPLDPGQPPVWVVRYVRGGCNG